MEQTTEQAIENRMVDAVSQLVQTVREVARDAAQQAAPAQGGGGAPADFDVVKALGNRAPELFECQSWRKEMHTVIESAFQTVLPQLIKRLRKEITEQVSKAPGGGEGGEAASLDSLLGSETLKEMLDEKFRHMLLYLKQEVIPKAVRMATGDSGPQPSSDLRDSATADEDGADE